MTDFNHKFLSSEESRKSAVEYYKKYVRGASSETLPDMTTLDFDRTYRYPTDTRISYVIFGCFGVLISLAIKNVSGLLISLVIVLSLCIYGLVDTDYSITITNNGIRTRRLRHEKHLRWDEIGRITNRTSQDSLRLRDHSDSVSLLLDSHVEGYPEMVRLIQQKRPDLWNTDMPQIFHQASGYQWLIRIGLSVLVTVIGTHLIWKNDALGGMFVLIVSILVWARLLTHTHTVALQDDELMLKSITGKQYLQASNINAIRIKAPERYSRSAAHSVVIRLESGKTISLSGFKEGLPMLYHTLRTWWQNKEHYPHQGADSVESG